MERCHNIRVKASEEAHASIKGPWNFMEFARRRRRKNRELLNLSSAYMQENTEVQYKTKSFFLVLFIIKALLSCLCFFVLTFGISSFLRSNVKICDQSKNRCRLGLDVLSKLCFIWFNWTIVFFILSPVSDLKWSWDK